MTTDDQLLIRDSQTPEQEMRAALNQLLQMATGLLQSGEYQQAEALYRAMLEAQPDHPEANHHLGLLMLQTHGPAAGLPFFDAALKASPQQEAYWLCYIETLVLAGHLEAAQQVLALGRTHGLQGDVVEQLALRLSTSGLEALEARSEQQINQEPVPDLVPSSSCPITVAPTASSGKSASKTSSLKSRSRVPTDAEIAKVTALFKQGRTAELEALARGIVNRLPQHGYGWKVLGAVLSMLGRLDEALPCLQKAVSLLPQDAEAMNNLGSALLDKGRLAEAEASLRRALSIRPGFAEAHNNLGNVFHAQARLTDAQACLYRALQLRPDYAEAHSNLGYVLKDLGRPEDAEVNLLRALALKPGYFNALCNLASLYQDQSRHSEAAATFRRAITLQPHNASAYSNLLFCLLLDPGAQPAQVFAEHLAFGRKFETPLRVDWRPHSNSKDPDRTLHIGFVSGDFYGHAIASFIEPVLASLVGRKRLAFHAYYTNGLEDATTRRLRRYFGHWNLVVGMGDADLADKIRADGIDILVDLSGHTAKNRLLTFARKPAPVQLSWMGYPGTTGLQAMDYYVSDRFLTPPGLMDDQFTEQLALMPSNSLFQGSENAPPVNDLPALQNGFLTFGSFNRPNKISQTVVAMWSRILLAMPDSKMLLGGMHQTDSATLVDWFEREGVVPCRLEFHPKTDMGAYLALHQRVDICLDTFPYNGGTTTLHALSMGVPTLSLAGQIPVTRSGASILGRVGLEDFVRNDSDDFVCRAVYWASHLPELAQLREGMRERLVHSFIGQPTIVAAGLDQAWRMMWQRWCAGLPAQSFELTVNDLVLDTHEIGL